MGEFSSDFIIDTTFSGCYNECYMKGDNSPSIRKDDLLNMEIMLPEEGIRAFQMWEKKSDKTEY